MTEVTIGPHRASRARRMVRSKRLLILVTLAIAIPVIWLSGFRSAAEPIVACETQYDALVKQAKGQLINGDRAAAIESLITARAKLRDCETPSAKDVAPIWPN